MKAFDIDISMFFRPDDDLGFGNRPEYALMELDAEFNRRRAATESPTKLPPLSGFSKLVEKFLADSNGSSGSGSPPPQRNIGGR